jgi:hypothetical protein
MRLFSLASPILAVLATACIIPAAGAGGGGSGGPYNSSPPASGGYGGGGTAGSDGADGTSYGSSYGNAGGAGNTPAAPAASQTVSVTIRSSCGKTVSVFYGDKPKFGSGTTSSISSNSVQSKTFQVGDMMWVLDDSGNGAGSVTISSGTRNIEITSSCSGMSSS